MPGVAAVGRRAPAAEARHRHHLPGRPAGSRHPRARRLRGGEQRLPPPRAAGQRRHLLAGDHIVRRTLPPLRALGPHLHGQGGLRPARPDRDGGRRAGIRDQKEVRAPAGTARRPEPRRRDLHVPGQGPAPARGEEGAAAQRRCADRPGGRHPERAAHRPAVRPGLRAAGMGRGHGRRPLALHAGRRRRPPPVPRPQRRAHPPGERPPGPAAAHRGHRQRSGVARRRRQQRPPERRAHRGADGLRDAGAAHAALPHPRRAVRPRPGELHRRRRPHAGPVRPRRRPLRGPGREQVPVPQRRLQRLGAAHRPRYRPRPRRPPRP